jgi:hypothetical protein
VRGSPCRVKPAGQSTRLGHGLCGRESDRRGDKNGCQSYIDAFEGKVGKAGIDDFWAKKKATTDFAINTRYAKSELGEADKLIERLNEDYSDNGLVFERVQLAKRDAGNPFEKTVWGISARRDEPGRTGVAEESKKPERVSLETPNDISDEDFINPTRDIELPALPENTLSIIGSEAKPVLIKKSVLEKNGETHLELSPEDSRDILSNALYNPDLVGQSQPQKRGHYWLTIKTGDKNSTVVIDVYPTKDAIEVVGWRYIDERGIAKLKRQAEREGGQILILSPNDGSAAALSALPPDLSAGKGTATDTENQKNGVKKKPAKFQRRLGAFNRDGLDTRGRILHDLAAGARFVWGDKVSKGGAVLMRGLEGSLFGGKNHTGERRARIGLLANPEKGGVYPEQYAHSLFEEDGGMDDSAVLNELLETLRTVTSRRQALEALENGYTEEAYSDGEISDGELAGVGQAIEEGTEARDGEAEAFAEMPRGWIDFVANMDGYLENVSNFDELSEAIERAKADGVFTFPFSPEDYREIKKFIDNDRRTESFIQAVDRAKKSGTVRFTDEEARFAIAPGTESERAATGERGADGRDRLELTPGDELTPLQRKAADGGIAAYDKRIRQAKKELSDSQKAYDDKRRELFKKQDAAQTELFGKAETPDLFGGEVKKDFSRANLMPIFETLRGHVERASAKLEALRAGRGAAVARIVREARAQGEILTDEGRKSAQEQLADAGGDILALAGTVAKNAEIAAAGEQVNTSPTEGQKEAGNYKKGHVKIQGFDITVEQPRGSTRSGTDENGKAWSQTMHNTYGYFRGTEGRDKDHIDVFVGDNPASDRVFVVDQVNPDTGAFDEHKVMLGFNSVEEARAAYLSNYEEGWQGLGGITETDVERFRGWAEGDGRRVKPFAEYRGAKESKDSKRLKTSKGAKGFVPVSKEVWGKLIEGLKKSGLAKDVVIDSKAYAKAWDKQKRRFTDKTGQVYGFVTKDGTVYLNPDLMNANTPVHEFGHLWNSFVKENNRKLYDRGAELVKQSEYWARVNADPYYSGLSEEERVDEALAMAIGDTGELAVRSGDILSIAGLKAWLREVWEWLGSKTGIRGLSAERIADLTLEEFARGAVADLMGGESLKAGDSRGSKASKASKASKESKGAKDFVAAGITEANAREMEGIKAEALKNGTFMKAPNGKDVSGRLTEREWLQVNTGKFKKFFGDWTLHAKTIMPRAAKSVSEAQEIIGHLVNKPIVNSKLGITGTISNNSIGKLGSESATKKSVSPELHAKAVANIDILFQNAEFDITHRDKKGTYEIEQIHRLGSLMFDEKTGGYVPVMITVKELNNPKGNRIYSVESVDVEAQKNSAGQLVLDKQSPLQETPIAEFSTKIQQLVETTKKGYESQSKIVDGDGMPMKVYHGTGAKFTKFLGADAVHRNGQSEGYGSYFTTNKNIAEGYGQNVMEVFVNMKNPYSLEKRAFTKKQMRDVMLDLHGQNADNISNLGYPYRSYPEAKKLIDGYVDSEIEADETDVDFIAGLVASGIGGPEDIFNAVSRITGKDGSIREYKSDTYGTDEKIIVAPQSAQVKSATDNNGDFDGTDGDIRFHFVGEQGAEALDKAEEANTRMDNLAVAREMESTFAEKKKRIDKLRESKPIEITGKEIKEGKDIKEFKANALAYGKTLRGKYTSRDTGKEIDLSRSGIDEVLHHDGSSVAHIQSIAAIPAVIEEGIFIDNLPNEDKKKNPKVESYDYYVAGLRINGEDYTIRAAIAIDNEGNRYYDHKLTRIEKTKLIDLVNQSVYNSALSGLSSTVELGGANSESPATKVGENAINPPISDYKDKRLIWILQTNDKENARKIKFATGWERGADGKWRYEIPDFELTDNAVDVLGGFIKNDAKDTEVFALSSLIQNSNLFDAYPDLKGMPVYITPYVKGHEKGAFNGETISVQANIALSNTKRRIVFEETLAHEIQHAIQHIEGFAAGTSPDSAFKRKYQPLANYVWRNLSAAQKQRISNLNDRLDNEEYSSELSDEYLSISDELSKQGLNFSDYQIWRRQKENSGREEYHKTSGEVEARNASFRMGMTPEERRASLAEETEDVARKDQIFIESAFEEAQNYFDGEESQDDQDSGVRFQIGEIAPDVTEEERVKLDRKLSRLGFKIAEAWQDRYLPVKAFLDLLRKNGTKVSEFDDFYLQATQLNGKNDAQLTAFEKKYFRPFQEAIRALIDKGHTMREVENYVLLKHGLERNVFMREAAIKKYETEHGEDENFPALTVCFSLRLPKGTTPKSRRDDTTNSYLLLCRPCGTWVHAASPLRRLRFAPPAVNKMSSLRDFGASTRANETPAKVCAGCARANEASARFAQAAQGQTRPRRRFAQAAQGQTRPRRRFAQAAQGQTRPRGRFAQAAQGQTRPRRGLRRLRKGKRGIGGGCLEVARYHFCDFI